MTEQPLRYSDSGVNYEMMDPFKIACQKAAITTARNIERFGPENLDVRENTESRGESAYEVDIRVLSAPHWLRMAHVEEGLGTKNEIVHQMEEWQAKANLVDEIAPTYGKSLYRGIAIDNAAMILNDLATRGASPVSFLLHVAAYPSDWFTDEERNNHLIAGTVLANNLARSSWGGGESPALRDIINSGHSLLSGSAWGLSFPEIKGEVTARNIGSGDRIVLLESTGPHANGITLLRTSIVERLSQGYETSLPDGTAYGEAVLAPTKIYCRAVDEILDADIPINYAIHISGHGWRKLMRAQREFSYIIDKIPEPQPVFKLLQDVSGMTNEQIYGDYNMGAGFALFIDPRDIEKTLDVAQRFGYQALDAGYVENGPRRVVINPVGVEYKGEELQIR